MADIFNLAQSFLSFIMFSYIGIFVFNAFVPISLLNSVMACLAVIAFGLGFPVAKRSTIMISVFMFAIGTYFMVAYQAGPADWVKAFTSNAPVICLVLTVPLLGIVLAFEPYEMHLKVVTEKMAGSPYGFYVISSLSVTVLSSLLNVASFPLVYQLFKNAAGCFPVKLFYNAMTRGLLPNAMWSPSYISVALPSQYTNVSWFSLASIGILVALLGILINLAMGWVEYGRSKVCPVQSAPGEESAELARKGLVKLLAQMGALIALIVALEYFTQKSAMVIVPLVAFSGPLLLALLCRSVRVFFREFQLYRTRKLPSMINEMLLFSAIGYFGYGLGISDIPKYIPVVVTHLGIDTPVMLGSLIILTIALPSIIGVHPLISIAALAAAIHPGSVALTNMQMAGAFMIGYMLFAALSPFSVLNLVIASLSKQDPITIGLKQNYQYATVFALGAGYIFFVL